VIFCWKLDKTHEPSPLPTWWAKCFIIFHIFSSLHKRGENNHFDHSKNCDDCAEKHYVWPPCPRGANFKRTKKENDIIVADESKGVQIVHHPRVNCITFHGIPFHIEWEQDDTLRKERKTDFEQQESISGAHLL
jgi:hypothetical protein